MPGLADPDKELKACLDNLPFPRWKRANKVIAGTCQQYSQPAKPTYLNFNALGGKIKTWCMTGDAKHVLEMVGVFKAFNNDPVPFLDFEQLCITMRHLVAKDKLQELKDMITLFKQNGQNPRQLTLGSKWTLLTFASYLGRGSIVDYLTGKEGCFPAKLIDDVDPQGCTALIWAAVSGSADAVKVLIDRNADVNNLSGTKESPLMLAACRGHTSVVRTLIDREADVNIVDANGWGPIQKACWWGHDGVLGELMLEQKYSERLEKTLRAAAMLQGHTQVLELLDGKRGPRSFPRVSAKLFLGLAGGNERDIRKEVRTQVANTLKVHRVQFSDVAVPEIEAAPESAGKGKIVSCEIRILQSSVVGVYKDLKQLLEEAGSPLRKSSKLQVDPERCTVQITWPISKISGALSVKIAEELKKQEEITPRGAKKDTSTQFDLKNAPTKIIQTVVESVQESVALYNEVTKMLETSEPQAMAKLRDMVSKGRFFVEAPYVKEGNEDEAEVSEPESDDDAEKEEDAKQMLSTLMPVTEAKDKGLIEDICEHFQTTDVQKRFVAQFEKLKAEKRRQQALMANSDSPTAMLLAPTFAPDPKKPKSETQENEADSKAANTNNTLPQVRRAAVLAQKKLKALIVGKESKEWTDAVLNDPNAVPLGDPQREVRDVGVVVGGVATDPGIKGAARIDEKAKSRNAEAPNYCQIIDICRVGMNFATVDSLLACVQQLVAKADICWLDNKFRTPSALGYQDVNIGVRITLPGEKSHICEVQLSLDAMFAAKMDTGHALYEKMRSSLADLNVPAPMQDPLLRTIISMLDQVEGG